MGERYLIDSNTIIEFIANLLPPPARIAVAKIIDEEFNISFINQIEVLGHPSADKALKDFINLANIYDINAEIITRTIELRIKSKIKVPDAIIASTALVYNLVLVTRNVNDFKEVTGLKIENPWNIQV